MKKESGFGAIGIIIAIVAVVLTGVVTWRVWDANKKDQQPVNNSGSSESVFKIPELGVEFEVKGGVEPVYSIAKQEWEGTSYQSITMSTRQVEAQGDTCSFSVGSGFALMKVLAYGSVSDTVKVEPGLTADKVTKDNGYLTVNGKIYHVPQGVQSGQGICQDGKLESEQRSTLRESLSTLRPIK